MLGTFQNYYSLWDYRFKSQETRMSEPLKSRREKKVKSILKTTITLWFGSGVVLNSLSRDPQEKPTLI